MNNTNRVGGQAVIEGVMMRSQESYSVAVRRPDGSIVIKHEPLAQKQRSAWQRSPFIRGSFNLFDSLFLGTQTLLYSSAQAFDEEEEELDDKAMYLAVFMGLAFSVLLFMVLPTFLTGLLRRFINNGFLLNLLEGVVRVTIFAVYVLVIGQMKDIKRVFQYHGAEHKSINCYEAGLPLTVENVRKQSVEHVRCGTSFMLVVMLMAVLVFSFFGWQNIFLRLISRILLLPVIAGMSYELIMLAGKNAQSPFWRMFLRPGLWMQSLTTREPDDSQLEVAIAALKAVLEPAVEGESGC